jgi:hypothetical protein
MGANPLVVNSLAVDSVSENLIVGGSFLTAGGKASPYLAGCGIPTTTTSSVAPTTTTIAPSTTTTIGGGSTTTTTVRCPLAKTLGEDNPKLDSLRDFRDSTLTRSAVGRRVVQIYYSNAGSIDAALERSPALRALAGRVAEAVAWALER